MKENFSINHKKMEKQRVAAIFLDKIDREKDYDKKKSMFIDMMTYYDSVKAEMFQLFCLDLLQDRDIQSRDIKLTKKIKELEDIKMNQTNSSYSQSQQ